jgi:hypothetical protein
LLVKARLPALGPFRLKIQDASEISMNHIGFAPSKVIQGDHAIQLEEHG